MLLTDGRVLRLTSGYLSYNPGPLVLGRTMPPAVDGALLHQLAVKCLTDMTTGQAGLMEVIQLRSPLPRCVGLITKISYHSVSERAWDSYSHRREQEEGRSFLVGGNTVWLGSGAGLLNPQDLPPLNPCPPGRLHPPKVSATAPLAGVQIFKHTSLWGTFLIHATPPNFLWI